MRCTRYLPAAAASALAATLLMPSPLRAWTHLGGSLDLNQRDFRVYNNFSDAEANNNPSADLSFPGATGAPLAIWKAYVEWGSGLHGNGSGDPTQPYDLGSGGANFDPSWQGLADSPGGTDDNIVSELSGFGGGVLAFTELPISDGWRIRFYQDPVVWHDGPGLPPNLDDNRDLQGVAAHEFGHALGLGHSADFSATMFASASLEEGNFRSIEEDDRLGLQALYGIADPLKPRIETYELSPGASVTIVGQNFAQQGNSVWFTRETGLSDGTPLQVNNLSSTDGGTKIVCTIPSDAGPGDILVRRPGGAHSDLSNAFPFDPLLQHCPDPITYGVPKTTSQQTVPSLYAASWPSATLNDFRIGTTGGIPSALGILFSGPAGQDRPLLGGSLLVAPPIKREQVFQFGIFGWTERPVAVDPQMVGATRHYQIWFQDSADPWGAGLSDGMQVTFCP